MAKIISRVGILVLAVMLVLTLLIIPAGAAGDLWTDYVTAGDMTWYTGNVSLQTYTISTPIRLASVAKLVNEGTSFAGKTLYITANMDMSDHDWVPIGTSSNPFKGTIKSESDNDIKTISGINIDTAYPYTGFVGYMTTGVDSSQNETKPEIGALTLEGYISVAADGAVNIGGACGYAAAESKISGVSNEIAITVTGSGSANIGGILGSGSGAVTKCVNKSAINVGTSDGSFGNAAVGGIVGSAESVTIKSSIFLGATYNNAPITVYSGSADVGGIVGRVASRNTLCFTSDNGDLINDNAEYVWSFGNLNVTCGSTANVGGFVGDASGAVAIAAPIFTREISVSGTCTANVGGIVGKGTELVAIRSAKLTNGFTKYSSNGAVMQSESYGATNITVTSGNAATGGIIGSASGSAITGAAVGDQGAPASDAAAVTKITSTGSVGGIAGDLSSTSTLSGTVQYAEVKGTGSSVTGGAVGVNASANVTAIVQNAEIKATGAVSAKVGGVIGANSAAAESLTADTVTVTVSGSNAAEVGGVFGKNSAVLTDENLTKVQSITVEATGTGGTLGGLVGTNTGRLYSSGYVNTTGRLALSGIFVKSHLTDAYVGGAAGSTTANMEGLASKAISDVTTNSIKISADAAGSAIGGIVGRNMAAIQDSYIRGLVISVSSTGTSSEVGGIAGINDNAGTLNNVNITGTVTALADGCTVGGAIGENIGNIRNLSLGDVLELRVNNGAGSTLGGLVGKNTGTMDFCYSSTKLSGTTLAKSLTLGGLVGENIGTVTNSYRDTAVQLLSPGVQNEQTSVYTYSYVGGLIGKNSGAVGKCYVSAPVAVRTYNACAGGLVGNLVGGTVSDCYTAGTVDVDDKTDTFGGGFIGDYDSGSIINSYSAMEMLYADSAVAGGFFGRFDTTVISGLTRCLYMRKDSSGASGFNSGLTDSGAGSLTALNTLNLKSRTPEEFGSQDTLQGEGWDFTSTWRYGSQDPAAAYHYPELIRVSSGGDYANYDLRWYSNNTFKLASEAELSGLAALVNGSVAGYAADSFIGNVITVTAPIYMQSAQWVAIADGSGEVFAGTLEGGDNLISGLMMDNNTMAGLFGRMNGAVNELILEPFEITGTGKIAALTAVNGGTITAVTVNMDDMSSIAGGLYAGGVAADSTGEINDCTLNLKGGGIGGPADDSVESFTGGIVGKTTANIARPIVVIYDGYASITGKHNVGGVAGSANAVITSPSVTISCMNSRIEGTINVGGIVGSNTGNIVGTEAAPIIVVLSGENTQIIGTTNVGGITGKITGNIEGTDTAHTVVILSGKNSKITGTANVGGAAGLQSGSLRYADVYLTQASVAATGENAALGGAVGSGENGAVSDVAVTLADSCIKAEAAASVGGIVGKSAANGTISNVEIAALNSDAFTAENISGAGGKLGGIVGEDIGTLTSEAPDIASASVSNLRLGFTGNGDVGGVLGYAENVIAGELTATDLRITANTGAVDAGGAVGRGKNSVISGAEVLGCIINSAINGSSNIGGAAGRIEVTDNAAVAYKLAASDILGCYQGLTNCTVSDASILVSGASQAHDACVGGLLGKAEAAAVYLSDVLESTITVNGLKNVCVGGGVGAALDADCYLVGNNIECCGISADTSAVYRVGGFAGDVYCATVRYNHVNGDDTHTITAGNAVRTVGIDPSTDVGGFVGRLNGSDSVTNNEANTDVSVTCENSDNFVYVGGFAGVVGDDGADVSVMASYATGDVSARGSNSAYAGGFAGRVCAGETAYCYASGDVYTSAPTEARSGGFVGSINTVGSSKPTIHDCYAVDGALSASSTATAWCGGFAGYNDSMIRSVYAADGGRFSSSDYNDPLVGQNSRFGTVTNAYSENLALGTHFTGMDFDSENGDWAYMSGHNSGRPVLTAIDSWDMWPDLELLYTYQTTGLSVDTPEELGTVNCLLNDASFYMLFSNGRTALPEGLSAALTEDISLGDKMWNPIRSLRALDVIDGAGKSVSGLYRDASAYDGYGFVETNSGEIENLTVSGSTVTGGNGIGLVCGTNDGTVTNVKVTSSVLTGNGYAGAVCGVNNSGKTISSAETDNTVNVSAPNVGGIVGHNSGTVELSKTTTLREKLKGTSVTGGIAALNDTGARVVECTLWGSITSEPATGSRTIGGIVGDNKGTVSKCYDEADISVKNVTAIIGGIAGTNSGSIGDCFTASGITISGDAGKTVVAELTETVGGIVGKSTAGSIEHCMNLAQVYVAKNEGYVESKTFFGAIGGQISGTTLTGNVFDRQFTGSPTAYYDGSVPVRNPNDAHVRAYYTPELIKAALPAELAGEWSAAAGRFPILSDFSDDDAALLCVQPITFDENDTILSVGKSFLLGENDTVWSGDIIVSSTTGSLKNSSSSAAVTLTRAGVSRTIRLNGSGVAYKETCAVPTGLTTQYFDKDKTVTVTLATATTGAKIYYTLDGSLPDETKTLYDNPIVIRDTTTVRAVAIKEELFDSSVATAVYTKGEPPAGGGAAPAEKAPVIVDGVEYYIGEIATIGGVTTITPDNTELEAQISSAKAGGEVSVPVTKLEGDSTAAVELVLKSIEDMAKKNMTLTVQSGGVSYQLPTSALNTADIMKTLGAASSEDVPVNISVKVADDQKAAINTALTSGGMSLIGSPVEFTVTATFKDKTVEIEVFGGYVSRAIEMTEAQAKQVTTAVVYEPDGALRHVPTRVYSENGKWYAEINSITDSTYVLVHNEAAFADAAGKWFETVVSEMASRKVINGRTASTFDGDASITRAEFAAILVRALGLPADGNGSEFTDVSANAWYCGAVGTASEYGLINGRGNGLFDPQANITRQEAMAMVQRAAGITELAGSVAELDAFADADSIADWAKDAARWNVGSGLIQGDSTGMINGRANISRGETATIILRLLQISELVDVRAAA